MKVCLKMHSESTIKCTKKLQYNALTIHNTIHLESTIQCTKKVLCNALKKYVYGQYVTLPELHWEAQLHVLLLAIGNNFNVFA
jgi:hypothetical protein